MSKLEFFQHGVVTHLLGVGTWLVAGAVLGALYFLTLRWNVELFAASRSPRRAILLQFARFAAMTGVLAVIAVKFGALPLLVAVVGILAARTVVVRQRTGS